MTALATTPDFKMLFSASSDGTIFLFNISEEEISSGESTQAYESSLEPPKIMDPELS